LTFTQAYSQIATCLRAAGSVTDHSGQSERSVRYRNEIMRIWLWGGSIVPRVHVHVTFVTTRQANKALLWTPDPHDISKGAGRIRTLLPTSKLEEEEASLVPRSP